MTSVSLDAVGCLQDAGYEVVVNPFGRRPTESESVELLAGAVGVLAGTGPLTADVLANLPDLRVVSRCGVGVDNVDLHEAGCRGILVFTTADSVTQSVAELTIGLILAVLRRIPEADAALREGTWQPLMGALLANKTVGIVGFGRIGSRVALLVRAFGAEVVATDPEPRLDLARGLDVDLQTLDRLLAVADIVTLHVPYGPATHHLIDRARVESMKPGAVLINAARGGVVDEDALTAALASGHLAGAGFDTFSKEPYDGPLLQAPGTVLTCHMGSYATEARAAMEAEAIRNLLTGLRSNGGPGSHLPGPWGVS